VTICYIATSVIRFNHDGMRAGMEQMSIPFAAVEQLVADLSAEVSDRVDAAVEQVVAAKRRGGKVAVVTGSGPNIHEGVTTLIAELMRIGVVDAVTTSSAVVSHEMAGTLDRVKRCAGEAVGIDRELLPKGGEFELSLLSESDLAQIEARMPVDRHLMRRLDQAEGTTIIKAAGNLGYPLGLWIEFLSQEVLSLARARGVPFEFVAGCGADPRTMIGVGARRRLPVLVSIPQLVGGGAVGLAIGDSISMQQRAAEIAQILEEADVVIESAVALTQEIHDGPFERYTGHGLWAAWQGHHTFSLEGKTLVRIDLDPALEQVYRAEREGQQVQNAIAQGLPKTKMFQVPFRMEMSGFARHEGSIPIIGDIGVVWPVMAFRLARALELELEFISFPQQSAEGQAMRESIVRDIRPMHRQTMLNELRTSQFRDG
jgi:hypothetical protein